MIYIYLLGSIVIVAVAVWTKVELRYLAEVVVITILWPLLFSFTVCWLTLVVLPCWIYEEVVNRV